MLWQTKYYTSGAQHILAPIACMLSASHPTICVEDANLSQSWYQLWLKLAILH